MTSAFVDAAELMGHVLGAPGFPFVVVEHPISSADAAMLTERAEKAAAECVAVLLGQPLTRS
ncbi:MAG: hypothetical protein AAF467_03815 [Actinomycetota bacterium]